MDDADRAQTELEREEAHLADRIKAGRGIPSADNCYECGFEIPSERQIAVPGCSMCVDCAHIYEQKK